MKGVIFSKLKFVKNLMSETHFPYEVDHHEKQEHKDDDPDVEGCTMTVNSEKSESGSELESNSISCQCLGAQCGFVDVLNSASMVLVWW